MIAVGSCVRLAFLGARNAEIGTVRSLISAGGTDRALVAWPDATEQYVDVAKLAEVAELAQLEIPC